MEYAIDHFCGLITERGVTGFAFEAIQAMRCEPIVFAARFEERDREEVA
jgi:hypothetical protein